MAEARAPRESLAQLVERLAPGGRLVRMQRLRGGLGARMHVLDIARGDGGREKVVLRRFGRDRTTSESVAHEFRILEFLHSVGIAAPRPLLLDIKGDLFGVPAMVLSYIPGHPVYEPRDPAAWAEHLAAGLLTVHAVTPDQFDLSWLHVQLSDGIREHIAQRKEPARAHGPLAGEVHDVLTRELDRIAWREPCLVHDDLWPGNVVWYRGRLAGIIDWQHGELGDPRSDVAQCRADITMIHSAGLADDFREAYQRLAPNPLPDMWFFDLHRGLGALLKYEGWLVGYHDAGIKLTPVVARRRIEAFLRCALEQRP
jgi:aminoglycoside phosphotransferase (APT) family kinase protein